MHAQTEMLQLSFLLGFFLSFFALPGQIRAIFINSSLNETPSDGFDGAPPGAVCVNNTQHPTWGPTLDRFDSDTCQNSVDLFAAHVKGNYYASYDFYSRQVYPAGFGPIGYEAWPLAQGASSG